MPRQPRTPRAVQGKGGQWFRPPRPKPRMRSPPQLLEEVEEVEGRIEEHDGGYDTCGTCDSDDFTASLVSEALQRSLMVQDIEVASLLQALCQQLTVQEKQKQTLKNKWDSAKQKLRSARLQLRRQRNLQGQSNRYWWKMQRLRRQLEHVRLLQRHTMQQPRHMQWHGGYQHAQTHFPP